nr:MAG TPA: hypothetical protein [Bacteriophage sp.]
MLIRYHHLNNLPKKLFIRYIRQVMANKFNSIVVHRITYRSIWTYISTFLFLILDDFITGFFSKSREDVLSIPVER